jgi:hypothetical protein
MMREQSFYQDLAEAVYLLRSAFLKHRLAPPKAIELATCDDGKKFKLLMPPEIQFVPQIADNPEMVTKLCGVEIIYPAAQRAEKNGGWRYE